MILNVTKMTPNCQIHNSFSINSCKRNLVLTGVSYILSTKEKGIVCWDECLLLYFVFKHFRSIVSFLIHLKYVLPFLSFFFLLVLPFLISSHSIGPHNPITVLQQFIKMAPLLPTSSFSKSGYLA